jgi:ribosomal protein S18 acetylase RimI-like enzyme
MAEWVIERLRAAHDRAGFSCGHPSLDVFLIKLAGQYDKRRLGRTFVATQPGNTKVAGYYTLAAGSFAVDCLPAADRKKLPRHPVPTVHIGRLAVDREFRGKGLGETLLFHALRAASELSEKLGAFAVDVWSIDERASAFYQKYGFIPLADDPLHSYLPMKTVVDLFAS